MNDVVHDGVEREVKLSVEPGFVMPPLDGAVAGVVAVPIGEHRQEAVYHDTPDLRLAREGITLRHRSDDGWTLKLPDHGPGDALSRREITMAADPRAVPDPIWALVAARVRSSALGPVARLETVRKRTDLLGGDGGKVAEVVDDEVSVLEGQRVRLRFREVEVELAQGAPDRLLGEVVARLRAAGAGAPDRTPKALRALGPRAVRPPELAEVALGPEPSAADVLRAALVRAARSLRDHDPAVRTTEDHEAVCQAREAARRLACDLETFGELLDEGRAGPLRAELGWLADLLGEAGDADVLLVRLERQLQHPDGVVGARLLELVGEQRRTARERLLEGLESSRYHALLDGLVEGAEAPWTLPAADRPAAEVLPGLLAVTWRSVEERAARIDATSADVELHDVRNRATGARYAAEVAALVVGKPAQELADALAGVQEVLGQHRDACAVREWLRRAAVEADAAVAVVAGQLAAVQDVEARARREELRTAWRHASEGRLRTWLKR